MIVGILHDVFTPPLVVKEQLTLCEAQQDTDEHLFSIPYIGDIHTSTVSLPGNISISILALDHGG